MFAVNKHLSLNLSSSSLMCKKRFLLSMRENVRERKGQKLNFHTKQAFGWPKEVDKITKIKEGECLVLICLRMMIKCNWSAGLSWLIRCYNHSWRFLDKTSLVARLDISGMFSIKITGPVIFPVIFSRSFLPELAWQSTEKTHENFLGSPKYDT